MNREPVAAHPSLVIKIRCPVHPSPSPSSPRPAVPARIGVGVSGGLDSAVAAAWLQEQGHEVLGLTLRLRAEAVPGCPAPDLDRARRVCERLGIPHVVVDAAEFFHDRIIGQFVEAYARGRTPSPCVLCNQWVKFGLLLDRTEALGCTQLATGHYARRAYRDGAWRLLRAADREKDQSYFLHRLSPRQLARARFPLADWPRDRVARYARDRDLPMDASPSSSSQDLCFVARDGHGPLVEGLRPDLRGRSGQVVNTAGEPMGTHPGIHHFTVGQRKGLGIASDGRLYVRRIDDAANRLVIGPREELFDRVCAVTDVNWIAGDPPAQEFTCEAQIRYRSAAVAATARLDAPDRLRLAFRDPQFAVTPGQAAVLYAGDEVLGGGWISAAGEPDPLTPSRP